MKFLFSVLLCAVVFAGVGCGKKTIKEVTPEAARQISYLKIEAEYALGARVREYARSEEFVRNALKLNDEDPDLWVMLGRALRKQEKKDDARKAYKRAVELRAERYEVNKKPEELGQQAFALGLLGKTDEAMKLLEKGLKDHPDSELLKQIVDPRGLPAMFKRQEFKDLSV